jgi:hypothetical protein
LEEEVRWNGHSLRLDDLFSALRPNLNYLAPGSSDLQLAVRGRFPSGEADPEVSPTQLALADRAGADLMEEVRLEIQAGVDDGVVIDVIKRALLLSRVLLDKATVPDKARTALTRFVTYGEAAAFRSRNYVPLWKTVEDFGHYVDELMHAGDLIVALGDAFNEVRTEFASSEALEAALAAQQQRLLTLFENDPTVAVNHLFRTLLSTENNQRRLAQALKPPHAAGLSRDGFWEVAYTGFDPVRTRGVLTVLYRGAQPVILLKNSPLVQALEKVEENRSRLFIYYFLPWPQTFRPWDAATLLQARRILSAEFIETFPSFVRIVWAEYLRNFVRRVAAKLQNQSGSSESVT